MLYSPIYYLGIIEAVNPLLYKCRIAKDIWEIEYAIFQKSYSLFSHKV